MTTATAKDPGGELLRAAKLNGVEAETAAATTIVPYETLSQHLSPARYDVHSMAVISSSKINSKVTRVLGVLGNGDEMETTVIGQPKRKKLRISVVTLSAKAPVASKVVSVVEIVKRCLASGEPGLPVDDTEGGGDAEHGGGEEDDGKKEKGANAKKKKAKAAPLLFQYNLLHSVAPPSPSVARMARTIAGMNKSAAVLTASSLSTLKRKRKPVIEQGSDDDTSSPSQNAGDAAEAQQDQPANTNQDSDKDETQDPEDTETYFETAAQPRRKKTRNKSPNAAAAAAGEEAEPYPQQETPAGGDSMPTPKAKQHDVPILTIVLSRSRLEGLRSAYGEQKIIPTTRES